MHELTHEELGLLRKLVERHKWDREWLGVPFPDVCDLGAKLDAMTTDEDCTLKCICNACIDASFADFEVLDA